MFLFSSPAECDKVYTLIPEYHELLITCLTIKQFKIYVSGIVNMYKSLVILNFCVCDKVCESHLASGWRAFFSFFPGHK